MKHILVTGISGYIGGKVASALAAEKRVKKIVGIDIKEPEMSDKLVFYRQDIREPIDGILHRHDKENTGTAVCS